MKGGGSKNDAKSSGPGSWLDDRRNHDIEEAKQESSGSEALILRFCF